jgi:hypothetical protein
MLQQKDQVAEKLSLVRQPVALFGNGIIFN